MSAFDRIINGPSLRQPSSPATQGGAQQGTIHSVGETTAKVILDGFSKLHYFEVPFTRSTTPPQVGDKCLVVFTPGNRDTGWIVAWNIDS